MSEIPEPEWGDPEPKTISRTPLLIGLGALVIIAAVLAVARSQQIAIQKSAGDSPPDHSGTTGEWQSSFQHLVDAMELRFAGIDNRLTLIERAGVTPADVELAADLPPAVDPSPDREPFPVPEPAHVSVPDIEGRDA